MIYFSILYERALTETWIRWIVVNQTYSKHIMSTLLEQIGIIVKSSSNEHCNNDLYVFPLFVMWIKNEYVSN